MWVRMDVLGLFSHNAGSFSANLGLNLVLFSLNVGQKQPMFLGLVVYVLRLLHIGV